MWQPKSLKVIDLLSFRNVEFEFRGGKAIIVTGNNLDDPGQKVNGSGKSSLIESVAIAFSGSSIRDVKTKELIYNGCEHGAVELKLFNTQLNQELVIWRKIFANTKAAEYQAWINGVDQNKLYSDWNSFNAWIWKTLGITKEDFFSFYLITSIEYEPFLKIGDSKKKDIVNRFSGADKVDLVFPEIEKDSDEIGTEIRKHENDQLSNTTKLELLNTQLEEEKQKNSEDARQLLITQKEEALLTLLEDAEGTVPDEDIINTAKAAVEAANNNVTAFDGGREIEVKPFIDAIADEKELLLQFDEKRPGIMLPFEEAVEIAELEVEVFEFTKNYAAEYLAIANKKTEKNNAISKKRLELPKVKEKFTVDTNAIVTAEQQYNTTITETEKLLKEHETFESEVNKKLLDSITCPSCSHVFNLQDKAFNPTEAKAHLPTVQKEILAYKETIRATKELLNVDIPKKKEELNDKVLKAGESIRSEITVLNNELVTIGQEETALKQAEEVEKNSKLEFEKVVTAKKRELDTKVKDLDHDRTLLTDKVKEAERLLKNKNTSLDNDRLTLTNKVKTLELSLQTKENEYNAHLAAVESLELEIDTLKTKALDDTKIKKLETDINTLTVAGNDIATKLEEARKKKEAIDAWEINFKSFKSHLANKSIKNIEDYTNLFLQNMNSNLQINIDGYKTLSNKKIKEQITTSVKRDGFDAGSYGKFSGGERGRIDISTILSIQELINLNSKYGGMDFLCCDEIMDQVDVIGLQGIIESIQTLDKTIMIVSQNEINASSEYTLVIQKQNKVSTILN